MSRGKKPATEPSESLIGSSLKIAEKTRISTFNPKTLSSLFYYFFNFFAE